MCENLWICLCGYMVEFLCVLFLSYLVFIVSSMIVLMSFWNFLSIDLTLCLIFLFLSFNEFMFECIFIVIMFIFVLLCGWMCAAISCIFFVLMLVMFDLVPSICLWMCDCMCVFVWVCAFVFVSVCVCLLLLFVFWL